MQSRRTKHANFVRDLHRRHISAVWEAQILNVWTKYEEGNGTGLDTC